jgi:hypothetical protein
MHLLDNAGRHVGGGKGEEAMKKRNMESISLPHPLIDEQNEDAPGRPWSVQHGGKKLTVLEADLLKYLRQLRSDYNLDVVDRALSYHAPCQLADGTWASLALSYDDASRLVASRLGKLTDD